LLIVQCYWAITHSMPLVATYLLPLDRCHLVTELTSDHVSYSDVYIRTYSLG